MKQRWLRGSPNKHVQLELAKHSVVGRADVMPLRFAAVIVLLFWSNEAVRQKPDRAIKFEIAVLPDTVRGQWRERG